MLMLTVNLTAAASDLSDWAVTDYIEANSTGLLSKDIVSNNLKSNITREEFCELTINLYEKITNENLRVPPTSPFTDCNNAAVTKAYYNGIVTGVTETTFEPGRSVTRQEMAKILVNALNAAEVNIALNTGDAMQYINSYADASSVSDWAQSAMATMITHNLLSGNEYNQIMPLKDTTREQAMICVSRCYQTFAEITQGRYMLPIVSTVQETYSDGFATFVWSETENVSKYHVLIKNSYGNLIYSEEVAPTNTNYIFPCSMLGTGAFYVIVGAEMNTGDTIFSVPVNFNVINQPVVQQTPAPVAPETYVPQPAAVPAPVQQIIVPQNEQVSGKAQQILDEAAKYIGIKYVYGGSTPSGFDCSGFVKYVFNQCGIKLERVSRDQYAKNGTAVSKSDLRPGDLLFFGTGGSVSHVGIYVGDGQMIHSPSTGKSICYTSINSDYYLSHYIGAKRVL